MESTNGYYSIVERLALILRNRFPSIPVYISDKEIKAKSIYIRIFPLSQDLVSTSSLSRLYEYNFEIVLYYTIVNTKETDYKYYLKYSDMLESIVFENRNNDIWFDGSIPSIAINSEESNNDSILTTTLSFNCKHSIN